MRPRRISLDTQKLDQPQDTYPYGKNGVWNAQIGGTQNENGFLASGVVTPYRIIGVIEIDTYPIYFSTDNTYSAFGYHDVDNDVYIPVFDDATLGFKLNFNTAHPIKGEARRNFRNDIEVTWLELGDGNRNSPRWANMTKLGLTANDFLLFPKALIPFIETKMQPGGNLGMGAYFVGAKYIKKDGTETRYTTLSRPLIAASDDWNSIPGSNTGKALVINITGADTSYDRIRLVVVERVNGVDTPYELPELAISPTMSFIYTGAEKQDPITLDEVIIPAGYYENAKAITQLNDQLFLGNMEEEQLIMYQQYANMIKLRWKSELTPVATKPLDVITGEKRGWMHQEVGLFYVVLTLRNGRNSRAFVIPGPAPISSDLVISTVGTGQGLNEKKYKLEDTCRNINTSDKTGDFGIWINEDEVYPDVPEFDSTSVGGTNLRGQSVRHHRFPSIRFCKQNIYPTENEYGRTKLDVLGIVADNVIIPAELQNQVIGWEIYYAKRDYSNSLVLGQSLLMFGAQATQDTNIGNVTSTGGNWGSYQNTKSNADAGIGSNITLRINLNYFRMHGFDMLINKPSITPAYISLQLKEYRNNLPNTSIVFSDRSAVIVKVDYTSTDASMGIPIAAPSQILRVSDTKYLPNGLASGDFNNTRLEGAFVGKIPNPPAGLLDWDWMGRDYKNVNKNKFPNYENTYLANLMTIRRNVYISFYSQTLVRTGKTIPSTQTGSNGIIYGGDCFLSYMSFNTYGLVTKKDIVDNTGNDDWHTLAEDGIKTAHYFIGESIANAACRYEIAGDDYSKFAPKSGYNPDGGYLRSHSRNVEPNNVGYIKDCNAVGDLLNGIVISSPYDELVEKSPYKIVRSAKQVREGKINSWKNYNALDYYETEKNKGEIINLCGFNDKLIIHHADGFFVTRDKATLSADVLSITLGSGDIFQFQPMEARPSKLGYAGTTNSLACVLTPIGYMFPDNRTGEIFLFNGSDLVNIGEGLINFLLKYLTVKEINSFIGNGITIGYEQSLKRLLLTVKNKQNTGNNLVFVAGYTETPEFFAMLVANESVVYKDGRYQLFRGLNTSEYDCEVNPLPILGDYSFTSDEHVPNGTLIGTVEATGGVLPYSYISLTADTAGLTINPLTGEITVSNSTLFNKNKSILHLVIKVTDANSNTDTGNVDVTINNVISTPVLGAYNNTIPEHSPNGTAVQIVTATDEDGQAITYSIIGGNTDGAFAIDGVTGAITVANSSVIEYDTHPSFTLIVRATTAGGTFAENTVTVTITQVLSPPSTTNSTFNILESTATGTVVGSVTPATGGSAQLVYELKTDSEIAGAFKVITDPDDPDFLKIKVLDSTKLHLANTPYVITLSVYSIEHPELKADFTETVRLYICPFIVATDVMGETDTTAKIQLTPSGGIGPYTYLWSNSQTTSMGTGLIKDQEYSVTVTDSTTGCQVTLIITPNIEVLSGLKLELMYFVHTTTVTTDNYYPRKGTGSHNCNRARFEVFANSISQGIANLNNNNGTNPSDGSIDDMNRAPDYPNYSNPDALDRYWTKTIIKETAIEIATPEGKVAFNLVWTGVDPAGPHTNSSWLRITKDSGVVILSTTLDVTTEYEFDPYV